MRFYTSTHIVCALGLVLLGCQSAKPDKTPFSADPETQTRLSKPESNSLPRSIEDSALLAREHDAMVREQALATPRRLAEYIPILRDTLVGRGVSLDLALRVAQPLVKVLEPSEYDIIDVLFVDRQDINRDHQNDLLFTLRYGAFDGNGRGLLVLVLLSTDAGDYEAYTTDAVWEREKLDALPNLDAVRVSPQNGRPYFVSNTQQFPFTKLRLSS